VSAAAFFDLDRTFLSRSSSLALAGTFRKRGLIGRRQLAKAALAQLVFVSVGAGQARVGRTADTAMAILKGLSVDVMHEIAEDAWEPVLRPLVYREALDLAGAHADRGEPVFLVSAALQEVVETIAQKLDLTGALASRAEVRDGVYTGRLQRRLYGAMKGTAVVELATAEGLDLAASTAYSDSHSDLPFLEAVGHPIVVNPDHALGRVALARGWPIRRFRHRLGRA